MTLWTLFIAVAVFVGGHFVISGTPLRAVIIGVIGQRAFMGLFSVFALATLVWVILAYRAAPYVPLWEAGAALRWINLVLVALAAIFVVCGAATRNPTLTMQDNALKAPDPAPGILAVTRHPMMWGIACWALGHLLVRGDGAGAIMFGGFLVLALGGSLSQERKKKAAHGNDWARFAAATSYLPFVAIGAGRARFSLPAIGWVRLAAAVVVYVVLLGLHAHLFGVSPLPN